MNLIDDCRAQVHAVAQWFDRLADDHHRLPAAAANDALMGLQA
jgi:tRNA-dihydrouridine synthase B